MIKSKTSHRYQTISYQFSSARIILSGSAYVRSSSRLIVLDQMRFNPQTFGLAVAKCPKNKKQTGGQRRAQANALPQSLLVFSWDESCSQALVWGVADVSAVSLLADRAEHIGIEQQRAEWRSTSYIVWDVANSTALDAPVHLGRESLLRAKSVEHL